jgi:hypothetical protein
MALIDNNMAVIGDHIRGDAPSNQAWDDGYPAHPADALHPDIPWILVQTILDNLCRCAVRVT